MKTSNDKFLYETLEIEFGKRTIQQKEIPNYITNNLKHSIREYQKEAFQRWLLFYNETFSSKPSKPYHVLYNMATGSGKTLMMAGLMLDLYTKGYRNFLFFVDSNNLVSQTKDIFLNEYSSKYLFKKSLTIDHKSIFLKDTESFDINSNNDNTIYIKFTTIQQLHSDLENPKENNVTYEDFKNIKVVLIGDEAHHLQTDTKTGSLDSKPSWENTVEKVLKSNTDNILLEFTATLNYNDESIVKKYINKVIFRYDLKKFREDKFSKEVLLMRSEGTIKERTIISLLLNLYRQEVAYKYKINIKPVILFKFKEIQESNNNKIEFHKRIAELTFKDIDLLRISESPIIKKAFIFFNQQNISTEDIIHRLQVYFKEENCLNVNDDKKKKVKDQKNISQEDQKNNKLLLTLEDANNPIRAIFAVNKLDEGWDVLNLFDIVRLSESRAKTDTPMSEAQLIGRGARYCPFTIDTNQNSEIKVNSEQEVDTIKDIQNTISANRFTRKFDGKEDEDLKVLEELYYHTQNDSRYISELQTALIDTGIYEGEHEIKELLLKDSFKNSSLYMNGSVFINTKIIKDDFTEKYLSMSDISFSKKNMEYSILGKDSSETKAFHSNKNNTSEYIQDRGEDIQSKEVKLSSIPLHILYYAICRNETFNFNHLSRGSIFPQLKSIQEFIKSSSYLGNVSITFKGNKSSIENISHEDYYQAVSSFLYKLGNEIKSKYNEAQYTITPFAPKPIQTIFKNITIKIPKDDKERLNGDENFIQNKSWYVYNANYGTSEEKSFIRMFEIIYNDPELTKKYKDIYVLRNERCVTIYNDEGKGFEPDFLLFATSQTTNEKNCIYQIFIEPKGKHIADHDRWKEDYLKELYNNSKIETTKVGDYKVTAVPLFYNAEQENEFKNILTTEILS